MQRLIIPAALLLTLALGLFAAAPTMVSAAGVNCDDFAYQEDAQAFFDNNGGSPSNNVEGLDRDGDGFVCESLPSNGGGGGTDTGALEQPPVDQPAPVTEDTGTATDTTPVDTSVGATTDTTTPTTSTTTAATTSLPSTGVGAIAPTSTSPTTLLALFAAAMLAMGAAGLIRARRG